jgi:hypothetical protein
MHLLLASVSPPELFVRGALPRLACELGDSCLDVVSNMIDEVFDYARLRLLVGIERS